MINLVLSDYKHKCTNELLNTTQAHFKFWSISHPKLWNPNHLVLAVVNSSLLPSSIFSFLKEHGIKRLAPTSEDTICSYQLHNFILCYFSSLLTTLHIGCNQGTISFFYSPAGCFCSAGFT